MAQNFFPSYKKRNPPKRVRERERETDREKKKVGLRVPL
jgi:hypothetical protein